MIIYQKQMTQLSKHLLKNFENYASAYLRNKHAAALSQTSDLELGSLVREGINRSAHYEVPERREVLEFLDYMVLFGRNFDTDPTLKWAAEVFEIANLTGSEIIKRLRANNPLQNKA